MTIYSLSLNSRTIIQIHTLHTLYKYGNVCTPLKSTFFLSIFVRLPVALIFNKDVKTILTYI